MKLREICSSFGVATLLLIPTFGLSVYVKQLYLHRREPIVTWKLTADRSQIDAIAIM